MTSPAPSRVARAVRFVGNLARWGIPARSLLFGPLSLGDDLLCTTVLREARRRGTPFAMMTARPELFAGNPDPLRLLPIDNDFVAGLRRLRARVVQPYYLARDPAIADRDILPAGHILAEMCRQAGLSGRISLRPYLFLADSEKARGRLHPRQITLHSTGRAAAIPYRNKEWGPENLAAVAQLLAPDFHLVQVGAAADPALPHTVDLRGKTTLRETAAVLAGSLAFVGLEGFLAHLARAVECPSAIVFGGRARPSTFGYAANHNFFTAVSCAPCGLRDTCPHERICMTSIAPESVAAAVRELAEKTAGPLPVEEVEIQPAVA